jgi:hypothetical protein
LAELVDEFGDRVGFMGILLDYGRNKSNAVRLVENAGVTFINVDGRHADISGFYTQIQTGFVPTAGLFGTDGNLMGRPISGGVRGYRAAIEAELDR